MTKAPISLQDLRRRLYVKAKTEASWRFWGLYVHVCKRETLFEAYRSAKENDGAPGIDGVTFEAIEAAGAEQFLDQLREELVQRTYRPLRLRKVDIPKEGGKRRLSIPAIRDRVVQGALKLILEPIFEADFLDSSFGFRPGKSAHQAIDAIAGYLKDGFRDVYDADLKGYFDTISHDQLMQCLKMRITDRQVLKLIRMWLQSPVIERDDQGRTKGTRPQQGTPQGGVISPLLANVYLHWFEKAFHGPDGPANWAKAKMVRYADDFVILARYQGKPLIDWVENQLEGRFQLTINREKTRVVDLNQPSASVDFLGFTFRYDRDLQGRGHRYLNVFPSEKSVARARERLRTETDRRRCFVPLPELAGRLTRWLHSWANYFRHGYPRKAFRQVNWFLLHRLGRHLNRRSQRRYRLPADQSLYAHMQSLGLRFL